MDLNRYLQQLREDLDSVARAGDERTQQTAALLMAAIEPAARLAIMNALADLAAEVTTELEDRTVEVRLDGRDIRVAVSGPQQEAPKTEPEPQPGPSGPGPFRGLGGDNGDISRITLRLVEQIKGQAEQAAAARGQSLNSYIAHAVQGALSGTPHRKEGRRPDDRGGRRLRGWVEG